jgi:dTDP-4-dehydrorhamnose reductase
MQILSTQGYLPNSDTLILGAGGFLGSHFAKKIEGAILNTQTKTTEKFKVTKDLRRKIESKSDLVKILDSGEFKRVINCVALANVDFCERNPHLAHWVNSEIPNILSKEASERNFQLIHFSTDAVFDGRQPFPDESAKTLPLSVYGESKLEGEKKVLTNSTSSIVIRTNFFGMDKRKQNIFSFFYLSFLNNLSVSGYKDVYFTTLFVDDLVEASLKISELGKSGLFHVVGSERISKFEFGRIILSKMKANLNLLEASESRLVKGWEYRSRDLSLSNQKILDLGLEIPDIRQSVEKAVKFYSQQSKRES